jgi:hypothetical protein
MTADMERYRDYLKLIVSATYHRTAQMMSSPKDIGTLFEAVQWASQNTELGGRPEWIIPNRMFLWSGVNVLDIDTSTLRFIGVGRKSDAAGGKVTTRVTVIMRIGWYKFQFLTTLRTLARFKPSGLSATRAIVGASR